MMATGSAETLGSPGTDTEAWTQPRSRRQMANTGDITSQSTTVISPLLSKYPPHQTSQHKSSKICQQFCKPVTLQRANQKGFSRYHPKVLTIGSNYREDCHISHIWDWGSLLSSSGLSTKSSEILRNIENQSLMADSDTALSIVKCKRLLLLRARSMPHLCLMSPVACHRMSQFTLSINIGWHWTLATGSCSL